MTFFSNRPRSFARYASLTTLLGAAAGVVVALSANVAQADIDAAFADKVDVDPQFADGVNSATDIAFAPDGRALITRKNGEITIVRANGTKAEVPGKFGNVDTGSEKGLLSVVADPDVANNWTFYFYVSNGGSNGDRHQVVKGVLSQDADDITVDLGNPVVSGGLEGPANHDGGGMVIHDGQLYIGVGDTGANATPPQNKYGSCLNKANGKILRVNLDGSIPDENPLVGVGSVTACDSTGGAFQTAAPDERIFAWGFRNPWRIWVDPQTGLLWVGDVGESTREEISVGGGGEHYGYPFWEGTMDWTGQQNFNIDCSSGFSPSRPCTQPVHDYGHQGDASVTGGRIVEGCGWTNVFGGTTYLFAEYKEGWIRGLSVNAARDGVTNSDSPIEFGDFGGGPVSFRQDDEGALYVVFYDSGSVTRFAPSDMSGDDCLPPDNGMGGAGGQSAGGAGGATATAGSTAQGGDGVNTGVTNGVTNGDPVDNTSATTMATAGGNASSGDEGGCGCRVGGKQGGALALFAGLGLIGLSLKRRRRA